MTSAPLETKTRTFLKSYNPHMKTATVLNWCLEKIRSVPYDVTLRWTFYQALQHFGLKKEDYAPFRSWVARARHAFWNGWKPDTVVDDTRQIEIHGLGLLLGHVSKYKIPENFEKPSQYQWEALDDAAANELITSALNTYVDLTAIESVREEEEKATERWQDWIDRSFGGMEE